MNTHAPAGNGPLEYSKIAPLVSSTEVRLSHLYITFKCPVSGVEVASTARIGEMTPVGGDDSCSGHDFGRLKDALARGVKAMAGEQNLPFFGSPHADLHDADGKAYERAEQLPEAIVHHGTVRAFEAVSRRFKWDPATARYVAGG